MPETSGLFLKTGVLALYRRPDYAQALRRNHVLAAAVYQQPGTDNLPWKSAGHKAVHRRRGDTVFRAVRLSVRRAVLDPAVAWPKIGSASTERRSRSCAEPAIRGGPGLGRKRRESRDDRKLRTARPAGCGYSNTVPRQSAVNGLAQRKAPLEGRAVTHGLVIWSA